MAVKVLSVEFLRKLAVVTNAILVSTRALEYCVDVLGAGFGDCMKDV